MRLFAIFTLTLAAVSMAFAQSGKQIVTMGGNPTLPFSPAVKAGGLIYVAGTLGTGAKGAVATGDIKAQTRQTLDNISATLTAGGSSIANATSVLVYLPRGVHKRLPRARHGRHRPHGQRRRGGDRVHGSEIEPIARRFPREKKDIEANLEKREGL